MPNKASDRVCLPCPRKVRCWAASLPRRSIPSQPCPGHRNSCPRRRAPSRGAHPRAASPIRCQLRSRAASNLTSVAVLYTARDAAAAMTRCRRARPVVGPAAARRSTTPPCCSGRLRRGPRFRDVVEIRSCRAQRHHHILGPRELCAPPPPPLSRHAPNQRPGAEQRRRPPRAAHVCVPCGRGLASLLRPRASPTTPRARPRPAALGRPPGACGARKIQTRVPWRMLWPDDEANAARARRPSHACAHRPAPAAMLSGSGGPPRAARGACNVDETTVQKEFARLTGEAHGDTATTRPTASPGPQSQRPARAAALHLVRPAVSVDAALAH